MVSLSESTLSDPVSLQSLVMNSRSREEDGLHGIGIASVESVMLDAVEAWVEATATAVAS